MNNHEKMNYGPTTHQFLRQWVSSQFESLVAQEAERLSVSIKQRVLKCMETEGSKMPKEMDTLTWEKLNMAFNQLVLSDIKSRKEKIKRKTQQTLKELEQLAIYANDNNEYDTGGMAVEAAGQLHEAVLCIDRIEIKPLTKGKPLHTQKKARKKMENDQATHIDLAKAPEKRNKKRTCQSVKQSVQAQAKTLTLTIDQLFKRAVDGNDYAAARQLATAALAMHEAARCIKRVRLDKSMQEQTFDSRYGIKLNNFSQMASVQGFGSGGILPNFQQVERHAP